MHIDLFTLFAQIVNFVVLMLLLKRFLYKPILRTMDEREHRIGADLDEAESKLAAATREAAVCHSERQEIEDKRGEMLSAAQEEAAAWRRDLIQQARDEIEERQERWRQSVEREKQSFLSDLRQRAGEQVYEISRRVLEDLAGVDLERHIIDTFIARLPGAQEPGFEAFSTPNAEATPTGDEPGAGWKPEAVICTAFEIDDETRERIEAAVRLLLAGDFNLRFELSPDLICGIELRAGGQTAAWSLQNYLETLDENLSRAFARKPGEER
ncbi:MAG: F0F1 ATP synthase subunit delta [Thermoleophilia bacterium]|nr:F0F1 ATP synthase subunit delta [Thermoleophilia bacterium]